MVVLDGRQSVLSARPEPTPERVGGGISPRIAAAGAGILLAVVAAIGVSGRAPGTVPGSSPAVAAGNTPSPVQSALAGPAATLRDSPPSTPNPDPTPQPTPFVMPTPRPAHDDELLIHVTLGSHHLVGFLDESPSGRLRGAVSFRFPRPARAGILRVIDLSAGERPANVGVFTLSLHPLMPETTRSGTVLDVAVAAQPALGEAPRLIRDGYRLAVRAESRLDFALIRVSIEPDDPS